MAHLDFLYYTICYSIGLPSLALSLVAYLRARDETLTRLMPLLLSVTLQLIVSTALQYREANLPAPITPAHLFLTYAYFLAENSLLFTLPFCAHGLADIKRKRGDLFWTGAALAAGALVFTPFFLKYQPWENRIASGGAIYLTRLMVFAAVAYTAVFLAANRRRLASHPIKLLLGLALAFTFFWLLQIVHCELMPILPHLPLDLNLAPACYFIWNAIYLVFLVKRRFLAKTGANGSAGADVLSKYGVTAREAEIAALILKGSSNMEIHEALHISMATVKTHILNLYRKLGVKNRVQLVNRIRQAE